MTGRVRRRLRNADSQRLKRILPVGGPLLVGAIGLAVVRRDFVGIALMIVVPVILLCLVVAFAPDSWFVTGEDARKIVRRWERIPLIGRVVRSSRNQGILEALTKETGTRRDDEHDGEGHRR